MASGEGELESPKREGPDLAWQGDYQADMEADEKMACSSEEQRSPSPLAGIDNNGITPNGVSEEGTLTTPGESQETDRDQGEELDEQQLDGKPSEELEEIVKPESNMTLLEQLQQLTQEADEEKSIIQETHFKDYSRLEELNVLSSKTEKLCSGCEQEMAQLGEGLEGLKTSLSQLKDSIDKRLTNDGLMSWLDTPKPHPEGKEAVMFFQITAL